MLFCQQAVTIADVTQIGEARREANRLANNAGLTEQECGKVSIVATELATNLQRYAQIGELLIRSYHIDSRVGIELIAVDRGPGMSNVARCMEDGFSSGGTPGNGLGAVSRLATTFEIYSTSPGGTVVLARIEKPRDKSTQPSRFEWGAINRPAPNEVVSGDTWRIAQQNNELNLMIADGLGHGVQAAEASRVAADVFEDLHTLTTTEFLAKADQRMHGTRGAAIAIAQIKLSEHELLYAGVGNIAGSIREQSKENGRGLVSHNGTVGAGMRKLQQFEYECPAGSLVILHSDGLKSRWNFDGYPGLIFQHPAIVASVLYRDFRRDHDDVTVCVVRTSQKVA